MTEDFIDYSKLIDDAMHIIVQRALEYIQKDGLPGNHHFFISFITGYPDVVISEKLLSRYPEEMTIVLQHQFDDLEVSDHGFSVTLSFDGVKEHISVPFSAITAFADPSVKFGLQFRQVDELGLEELAELEEEEGEAEPSDAANTEEKKPSKSKKKGKKAGDSNVVSLDNFRKK